MIADKCMVGRGDREQQFNGQTTNRKVCASVKRAKHMIGSASCKIGIERIGARIEIDVEVETELFVELQRLDDGNEK